MFSGGTELFLFAKKEEVELNSMIHLYLAKLLALTRKY